VYADADFARDPDDRRSVSGGAVMYGGAAVSWFSRVQTCVATSSTEAEYVSISDTITECEFVRGILRFLGPHQDRRIVLHEDDQGAIRLATNPLSSARSRHIDVRYHYIRHLVKTGSVIVEYVATDKQHADILTKPVEGTAFQMHSNFLLNSSD